MGCLDVASVEKRQNGLDEIIYIYFFFLLSSSRKIGLKPDRGKIIVTPSGPRTKCKDAQRRVKISESELSSTRTHMTYYNSSVPGRKGGIFFFFCVFF